MQRLHRAAPTAPAMCQRRSPVQAGAAKDASRFAGRHHRAESIEKLGAGRCDLAAVVAENDVTARNERVRHGHAQTAGNMVVTGARSAHCIIQARRAAAAGRQLNCGNSGDAFKHAADERRGKAVIAVPALLVQSEQTGTAELGKMAARGLRRDTCNRGELGRGERATVDQCRKDVCARGVAHERAQFSHVQMRGAHAA